MTGLPKLSAVSWILPHIVFRLPEVFATEFQARVARKKPRQRHLSLAGRYLYLARL